MSEESFLLLDFIISGILFLTPAIIVRFAILKKGIGGFKGILLAAILGIVSQLLCIGVYYLVFGFIITGTSMPYLWIIINSVILGRKSNKDKKDERML